MAAMFWTLLSLAVLCGKEGHVSGQPSPKLELEIVGIFLVHSDCYINDEWANNRYKYESVRLMEAMRFAIEEINTNSTILPGIKLVPSIRLICGHQTIETQVKNMSLSKPIAAVTEVEVYYMLDKVLASLQALEIPVIGSSSTGGKIAKWPFHLRMIPDAQCQSGAIIDLLTQFNWTYVSVLASFDVTLTEVMKEFNEKVKEHKICIATSIIIFYRDNYIDYIRYLQRYPRAQVLVLFVDLWDLDCLLTVAHEHKASFTWVVAVPWGLSQNILAKYKKAVGRIITVNILSYPLQRFNEYFKAKIEEDAYKLTDTKFTSLFSEYFLFPSKDVQQNNENRKHKEFPPSPKIMYVVNAVYAIAHALRDLYTTCHNMTYGCLMEHNDTFMTSLKNTTFTAPFIPLNVQYTVKFDGDGYGPALYDIFTIQENNRSFQYQSIGSWAHKLTLKSSHIIWENNTVPESKCGQSCGEHERKIIDQCSPCCWICIKCQPDEVLINETTCKQCNPGYWSNKDRNGCLDFIQYGDGLAIGSVCFSCLGIISTIFVGGVLMKHNNTPIVKASGREFCYILLSGVLLLFTMTFIFIARPSVVICILRRLGLATSFSICYSALLTKTIRITRIFNGSQKGIIQLRYINLPSQLSFCLALITCQLLALIIWQILDPAEVIESESPDKHKTLKCKSGDMKILISLAYDVLLILLCTVYAFKTRKYPENFNEAKCIGFTMYTTCIIWLAFLPVYYVTSIHPKVQVTTLCISISLCAFVILGGLFVHKLYIILYHPEKNVKSGHWCKSVSHPGSSHGTTGEAFQSH